MSLQVPILNSVAASQAVNDAPKRLILTITRTLTEDKMLFKDFKLIEYDHDIHHNLPINSYDWEILILDLREKGDRYCYLKEVQSSRDQYKVVVFSYKFEGEILDDPDNVIYKLPERQARKEDFYQLLLAKRINKPRWYVGLFKCLFSYYRDAKN